MNPRPIPPVAGRPARGPVPLRELFADPHARNYVFAGLGGLAMTFAVLLQAGADLGGLMVVLVGAGGIVLRWPAAPAFVLVLLTYFLLFPTGLPPADDNPFEIEDGRFRVADVFLTAAVLVYLACHYRVYGLTAQAMPFETREPRGRAEPTRRPAGLVRPGEVVRLLVAAAVLVVVGQVVWYVATTTEPAGAGGFPLRWRRSRWGNQAAGEMPPGLARFAVLGGLLGLGTLLARLVFGYWRLRRMTPGEGGMILQDGGWDETRRERVRLEVWRRWGRGRAEKAARAGRARGAGR